MRYIFVEHLCHLFIRIQGELSTGFGKRHDIFFYFCLIYITYLCLDVLISQRYEEKIYKGLNLREAHVFYTHKYFFYVFTNKSSC